jgi:hypothetical protein
MTIDQLAEYIRSAASECNSGTFDLPFDIARYIAYHLAAIYNDTDRPITQGQAKDLARINVPKALLGEPERAKAGEWISVKERLPEPDVDYLWHVASGSCPVQIGSLNRHKDIVFTERGYYSIREVFNWQPLPDPPAPAASSAAEGSVATGEGGR